MKVKEFDDGYKGRTQRSDRTSGAIYSWELLMPGPTGMTVIAGGTALDNDAALAAINNAYNQMGPSSAITESETTVGPEVADESASVDDALTIV